MQLLIEDFHSACASIFHERASKALNYAVGYAEAGLRMRDPKEIQVQCFYILNNIQSWRGPTAKRCRETLKKLSKSENWGSPYEKARVH